MENNIIITGAAQRLGLHCALTLQHAGYQVIATYRSEKPGLAQLRAAGVQCVQLDVTEQAALAAFISRMQQQLGSLRALIHNASDWKADLTGAQSPDGLKQDAAIYDAMQAVHAKAPYLLNRAFTPLLQAQNGASDIIHLTDFVASVGSSKHMAYAASKAALENLTYSFARALAPKVKVNAIAPALLMFNQHDDEPYRQKALRKSLLQCEPGAEEMSNAVQYLLNSRYITGKVIALDGGRQLNLP
ncbi:dihydromonapterin reductase [Rheinheimera nanhaiensis]|uniref:Dihydromonapterin reductase n=1 Tax=Rheinheimera nanhaiensis E407-8 TaxID=562729 RepID=I1DU64_9GAMM|nr:dihydromonapterin reductase [Rheinheimera nanhaiensis]GAB57592.1 dihydromonapterin reductase [Rheinheimera nanhaiensis E407-8]